MENVVLSKSLLMILANSPDNYNSCNGLIAHLMRSFVLNGFPRRFIVVLASICLALPILCPADDSRARLDSSTEHSDEALVLEPLRLEGGSRITVISPAVWKPLAQQLTEALKDTHAQFSGLFGDIPSFSTSVRLMDEEMFFLITGAPRWTNAMYYKGQIVIPLAAGVSIDVSNLKRSIKHEYAHALINSLSDGKCPGWLDEGLAQWSEGVENPALKPALLNWLKNKNPVPFELLQGGFTKLTPNMVPAAYAQSLFATNTLISTHGFQSIGAYFKHLRTGKSTEESFREAYSLTERGFEQSLRSSLKAWVKRDKTRERAL